MPEAVSSVTASPSLRRGNVLPTLRESQALVFSEKNPHAVSVKIDIQRVNIGNSAIHDELRSKQSLATTYPKSPSEPPPPAVI